MATRHRKTRHRQARLVSGPLPHPLLSADRKGIDVNTAALADAGGLLTVLGRLTDPRSKRGIRHRVASILTIAATATLAGCRSLRPIADFAADLPQDALERLGAAAPGHRPLYPAERAGDPPHYPEHRRDEADALAGRWLLGQVRAGRVAAGQAPGWIGLALDGKTLKGSWSEINTGDAKVRLFFALLHGEGVIAGQRLIPSGTGEPPR